MTIHPVVGPAVTRRTISSGGRERSTLIVTHAAVDSGLGERRRPLIVFFHGTGQSGSRMRRFSGASFDELARSIDAVIAYPDGYRKDWNGTRDVDTPAQRDGVDDVAFFIDLVNHLAATERIDPDQVFVVGFSLGGQMVMRLLHDAPERLAGAAIISSTQPDPSIFFGNRVDQEPTRVPVIIIHGTEDPLTPYGGGKVSVHGLFSRGQHLSALATAGYYAARNGHVDAPINAPYRSSGGHEAKRISTLTYGPDTDAPVTLVSIEGGGHQVPNPNLTPLEWFWGHSSREICCAEAIAEFFGLAPAPDEAESRSTPSRRKTLLNRAEPMLNRGLNAVVQPLLGSPASRAIDWLFVTITYTGRRSGKTFSTPVMYFKRGGTVRVHVASPDSKTWWRNFTGDGGPITLYLHDGTRTGHARAVRDDRDRVTVTVTLDD